MMRKSVIGIVIFLILIILTSGCLESEEENEFESNSEELNGLYYEESNPKTTLALSGESSGTYSEDGVFYKLTWNYEGMDSGRAKVKIILKSDDNSHTLTLIHQHGPEYYFAFEDDFEKMILQGTNSNQPDFIFIRVA